MWVKGLSTVPPYLVPPDKKKNLFVYTEKEQKVKTF